MNDTEKLAIAVKALKALATPTGAWSNDHHKYLENVIGESIRVANEALKAIGEEEASP